MNNLLDTEWSSIIHLFRWLQQKVIKYIPASFVNKWVLISTVNNATKRVSQEKHLLLKCKLQPIKLILTRIPSFICQAEHMHYYAYGNETHTWKMNNYIIDNTSHQVNFKFIPKSLPLSIFSLHLYFANKTEWMIHSGQRSKMEKGLVIKRIWTW